MTLADILPTLRQLPESEKLELVRLLADDLCSGMKISPFEPFKTYFLPTPYNAFGAGAILMQTMSATEPLEQ
ncbi:hypothetical protein D0962_19730 [Leptolyngbyaceae cyanobacterium CCMR0082]|uniref:Uncharacterized protein n=1 Tax=Adonisia turfae CCMR0082 TaxID=2304604 RepID=A0A6M0S928_9CYAN|nr:hypothetical protein [Adonisia turfae]MDV3352753.1 hypothetical protein [Leptothoe sp. LEGE 181152]NEZ64978.1 hypothetical protein [Adonisia turfae CCMR0082]